MVAIWGPGINVAIFLVLYSYRRYAFILHALAGLFACIYTLAVTIPIITTTGIVSSNTTLDTRYSSYTIYLHYIIGTIGLFLIAIAGLLGIICRMANVCGASSNSILALKKIHLVAGYLAAWMCKLNNYVINDAGGTAVLAVQDVLFMVLIVVWKYKFPRL